MYTYALNEYSNVNKFPVSLFFEKNFFIVLQEYLVLGEENDTLGSRTNTLGPRLLFKNILFLVQE